jgi:DNA (cytosine-5)-methyltransferase 1
MQSGQYIVTYITNTQRMANSNMGVKINLLDLFSGIGGFHLGLEKAGFKVNSFNSEIDKYATQVYKHNFKNSKYVGSITDVRGQELPRINGITFGSPCQDFSLAGKRRGMSGERSSLILEAIRLIKECRPDFFIWENVKGTFSSNNRQDFAAILQAFANVGGYRLEWQLLNTKWFLPQNRERVYLVGYIGDGSTGQIFPIGESSEKVNELQGQQGNACTLTTRYGADGNGSYITERKQYAQIKTNNSKGFETITEGDSLNYSNPNSKTRRGRVGKGVAQTLDTACNMGVLEVGDYRYDKGYRKREDGISPTLRAKASTDISSTPTINKIRRFTPIECERLQGFPDNWTKYGSEGLISDTQRYKMCGNAVTVDVVKAVGERIKDVVYG